MAKKFSIEDVEQMNVPTLKVHLENLGLSTNGEGAGRGGRCKKG